MVDFLLRIVLLRVYAVGLHPSEELMMVHDILFKSITRFVNEVDAHLWIIRIHLAATFIDGQENRFNTTRSLCHERCCTRGSYRKTSYIAATIFHHVFIELWVGFFDTKDKRIFLFTLCIENLEVATFTSHRNAGAISFQCKRALNRHSLVRCFLSTIAQREGCQHVALSRDT